LLDFRHETFLALCEIKNYTKTAEHLHMTQPAVTQHIQYLEKMYGGKLFHYKNKRLTLSDKGKKLRQFITHVAADSHHFIRNMHHPTQSQPSLVFGATLSIGEYVMPDVLAKMLNDNPKRHVHMEVGNTEVLLDKLWKGKLDFVLLEGIFDKSKYHSELFHREKFIPVCAPDSEFARRPCTFSDILHATLVLREKGSGTRDVLENLLEQHNYSIASFKTTIEIGNMTAIKKLVQRDLGISFMYEMVAKEDIRKGNLATIPLKGFDVSREFNFVFLKDSYYKGHSLDAFKEMRDAFLAR